MKPKRKKEYVCPKCGHQFSKEEMFNWRNLQKKSPVNVRGKLTINCSHCGKSVKPTSGRKARSRPERKRSKVDTKGILRDLKKLKKFDRQQGRLRRHTVTGRGVLGGYRRQGSRDIMGQSKKRRRSKRRKGRRS